MKRKPNKTNLSAEFVRAALTYEPINGLFRWKRRRDRSKRWNNRYAGTIAGQISCGYRLIELDRAAGHGAYRAARLAWLYMTGEWPSDQIDHINGQRGDDRWENLRAADNAQNNSNRGAQSNNKAGVRGVSRWGNRWKVRIRVKGTDYKVGAFDTIEEAAAAYAEAAVRLHGDFARVE